MADPRWRLRAPGDLGYTDDPTQDPIVATQWGMMNPLEGMSMPPLPSRPPNAGNTALNLAGILGGLGLGLARPRLAPQALQNFSAANMMEWRDTQRELAEQRLALALREEETKRGILAQMGEPDGGPQARSTFTAPPPSAPQPPQVSNVPHFAAQMPGSLTAPTQFAPEARLAEQPSQPFFQGGPTPIQGNTSKSLSAYGLTQTRSTNRGTEKEQATNNAVNDLTTAWMQNPEQAQRDPRRLLKEVIARNPQADSKAVRESLSNTLFDTYHTTIQTEQPELDPKSVYRQAYSAASRDLPGLFMPTDQMRTLATQSASVEEQRGLAASTDNQQKLTALNIIQGNTEAAITGAKNAANFATKPYDPGEAQKFVTPPPVGTTPRQQAGRAPMSVQQETGITVQERERSQTQTAVETVAPAVAGIVKKAEDIRKSFEGMGLQDLYHRGKNWLDVMQSQITGFPATEMGKLVQSYDTLVENNGPLMARVVQAQRGNLTEMERKIGERGFPATFRELFNNPVAGNDRLAVLSDVLGLELRDPTFTLGRLDVPASEFEKSIEATRRQRIAIRPELYSNAPTLGVPSVRPSVAAPPAMSNPLLAPEDQAIKDRITQELQQRYQSR